MPHITYRRGAGEVVPLHEGLPAGAHLTTPRLGFSHHGIYVGDGRVIHYAGYGRRFTRGRVEEVSLEAFSCGRGISTIVPVAPAFDGQAVVARARSRLGEDRYRLWTNNCEHFCEWCICGADGSHQVDALRKPGARAMHWLGRSLAATGFVPWELV